LSSEAKKCTSLTVFSPEKTISGCCDRHLAIQVEPLLMAPSPMKSMAARSPIYVCLYPICSGNGVTNKARSIED